MEEEQAKDIQDYIIAIRKRKTAIFSIVAVIIFITALIAFLLPAIYKSSSTILIEQQEIPPELVMSTVTSYAAERIQSIQARVMTRTNLLELVDKYNLYQDERKFETNEEIVTRMQEDVGLEVISAEVVDPRTGRPSAATIAFSLSYQGESPEKVQRVVNELTSLYLNENLTSRSEKATETSRFFKEEAERLGNQISVLERKLADFKQQHANALPELQQLNLSVLQRKENDLLTLDATLRTLDEKRFYLTGQLAQIDPGNASVPGSAERLKILQAEYASAKSRYSPEHPDVLRLKNEIETLEEDTGKHDEASALADELKLLQGQRAQNKDKYTAEHPDMVALQDKIDDLNEAVHQKR